MTEQFVDPADEADPPLPKADPMPPTDPTAALRTLGDILCRAAIRYAQSIEAVESSSVVWGGTLIETSDGPVEHTHDSMLLEAVKAWIAFSPTAASQADDPSGPDNE